MSITKVFYIWGTDDEGGYGVCDKEKFAPHKNGECREILFEFNTREEFIEKFKTQKVYEYVDIESEADFYCRNICGHSSLALRCSSFKS